MRENSISMDIYRILLFRDLTNKEIRGKYKERYKKSINAHTVSQYLCRLKSSDLVKIVGKKKGKSIYRSKDRETYIAIVKAIRKLNAQEIPFEIKKIVYELIIKLLPANIERLMDNLLKHKTKEIRKREYEFLTEAKEEIKNLMYS